MGGRTPNDKIVNRTMAVMDIAIPPGIHPVLPASTNVSLHTKALLRTLVNMTGFTTQPPDYINVTAYNVTHGAAYYVANVTGAQDWDGLWNVSALVGAHNITVRSASGRGVTTSVLNISILAPPSTPGISLAHNRSYETHAYSYGAGTEHLYSFTHDAACGPDFTIELEGKGTGDMDLFIKQGAIANAYDETSYDVKSDGTGDKAHEWKGALAGETYRVLVRQASGGELPYVLRYVTTPTAGSDCAQGSPGATDSRQNGGIVGNPPNAT